MKHTIRAYSNDVDRFEVVTLTNSFLKALIYFMGCRIVNDYEVYWNWGTYEGWYCPKCGRIEGTHVTHDELCTICHNRVTG